ncbi:MAG: NAD-dependent epimerase/dehydratase family protein [Fimbriiglobus sp.]
MQVVVTGCAGFIGSSLSEKLLAEGHQVVGLDCFTAYYARATKESNMNAIRQHPNFTFHELDISTDDLAKAVDGAEIVFHLAAYPGLVKSWTDFDLYNRHNLTATQRLLEALKGRSSLKKFVYASTSSVYGKYASGDESLPTRAGSPYGVTKLAGEQLARVYLDEFAVPTVVVRFFSVYGPRQRPDMGYHLFINSVLRGQPIQLTGDGLQVRGNTYISDCIAATQLVGFEAMPGEVYNLGGGELTTIIDVIRKIERLTGQTAIIERKPNRKGDQLATGADVTKLFRHLGWKPTTGLEEGLTHQIAWQRSLLG